MPEIYEAMFHTRGPQHPGDMLSVSFQMRNLRFRKVKKIDPDNMASRWQYLAPLTPKSPCFVLFFTPVQVKFCLPYSHHCAFVKEVLSIITFGYSRTFSAVLCYRNMQTTGEHF